MIQDLPVDFHRRRFVGYIFFLLFFLTLSPIAGWAGGAQYVYDKGGRLVQVIADDGSSAIYNYDAAGNITKVQRISDNAKAFTGFSPSGGPPGTTVNIYGSGFSTTASSNSVSFNGTSATVTSASKNLLVVTVPGTATTGTLSVTVSGSTLISSGNFVVQEAMQPPIVSSFTPTVGVSGAVISITGSGFSAIPVNNIVSIGSTPAVVNTATPSLLTVTLGSPAKTGRIKVVTPFGTGFSSQFFLITPNGYSTANVSQSGAVPLGIPLNVSIPTAGRIAIFAFEGTKNQRIAMSIGSSTFTSCSGGSARLLSPAATPLGSINLCAGSRLDAVQLPETGTYSVLIAPASNSTGTLDINVSNVTDPSGVISVDGSSLTLSTTAAAQNYRVTFRGTAQQRVRVAATLPNLSPYSYLTKITGPDGTVISSISTKSSYASGLLILPKTGIYTIYVDVPNASVGQATFTAYSVPPDVSSPLILDGPSTSLSTTAIDQNFAPTFSGTAQQRVRLAISLVSVYPSTHSIKILNPDGSTLLSTSTTATWVSGLVVLPQSGTYKILADPPGESVGQGTFEFRSVPADAVGSMTMDAPAISLSTSAIDQNYSLVFSGNAQQRIRLAIQLPSSYPSEYSIKITNPDNSTLLTKGTTGTYASGLLVLPQSGTYKVYVDSPNSSFGQGSFGVFTVPADVTGALILDGPATSLSTTAIDQNYALSFSGASQQRVRLTVSLPSVWPNSHQIKVVNPDGSTFLSKTTTATYDSGLLTLPQSGAYQVYIDSYGSSFGTGTFGLNTVP